MAFEDAELGVSVHRGVYETAAVLYARFEPLVAEHISELSFPGRDLQHNLLALPSRHVIAIAQILTGAIPSFAPVSGGEIRLGRSMLL